jgi:hypothetical protein
MGAALVATARVDVGRLETLGGGLNVYIVGDCCLYMSQMPPRDDPVETGARPSSQWRCGFKRSDT